jgi:isocitrate dehydrogenase
MLWLLPAIRTSGQMWNSDNIQDDRIDSDRSYSSVYEATIEFYGAFDPTTMGSVPNVGLMAQKQKSTDHMTRRSK